MISVIVIGKNEGKRLAACLNSISTALGRLSHEVIYVDSCSTDQSLQTARSLGARCYLLAEKDTTAGLGRFVGAKEARGEYLLFLDGDMQLRSGFVEKALMAMASQGYDGVCGIREDLYMRGGEVVARNENYFNCTQERIVPEFGGALMITAEALAACGGWSTDTVACEESELHARLLAMGSRIAEIPVPMIMHTDAVRDNRSPLHTVFSARRLGEGQALACAFASHHARDYIRHEREKFTFYALDWLALFLLVLLSGWGFAAAMMLECMQLGWLLAKKRPRAFISQKLFFFGLPLGLLTYRKRSRSYAAE